MYIFMNALKNIGRNKGRNILLGLILLAIIGTTVVTLTITNTADSMIDVHQEQFSIRVIIQPDIDAVIEEIQRDGQMTSIPQLTIEETLTLAESNYVQDYRLTVEKMAAGYGILSLGEEEMNEMMAGMGGGGGVFISGDDGQVMEAPSDFIMPNLRFIGGAWLDDFENGERVLHEGEFPQAEGEVLISFDFAELNNLTIGDTVTLQGNFLVGTEVENQEYRLTITGIYMDFTSNMGAGMFGFTPPTMNRRNEILTSIDTIVNPLSDELENATGLQINVAYYLHNPSYLDYFEAEARAMGVSELLLFSSNATDFYAMVAPVEGLRQIAQTFLLVVLVLGGIILVLLSSIFIRERKYEIGVLRAMGMKRQKVTMGLWAEILVLTVACLVFGLGIGSLVAQPVSDTLLTAQVEAIAHVPDGGNTAHMNVNIIGVGGTHFGNNESTEYNPIDQLDLSLSANTILQIAGISFALMTVAAISSTARITKYEPIKILMERD